MNVINKMTYRNLKQNKKRSIVTIIGIMLSVALITAVFTMGLGLYDSVVEEEKLMSGDFHILIDDPSDELVERVKVNREVEAVNELYEEGWAYLSESMNADKPYIRVTSADTSDMKKLFNDVVEGRYPENENEIMLPRHLKTNGRVDYKVGDTITLELGDRVVDEADEIDEEVLELYTDAEKANIKKSGDELSCRVAYNVVGTEKIINTEKKTYTVVGICERVNTNIERYDCSGYTAVTCSSEEKTCSTIFIRLTKKGIKEYARVYARIMGLDEDLADAFFNGGGSEEDLQNFGAQLEQIGYYSDVHHNLIDYENPKPGENGMIGALAMICIVIAIIIIIASVFCIKNSFDISATEKTRQFGMVASVGATRKQIKKFVHFEGFILGIAGIPLGIGLGLLASKIVIAVCNHILKENLSFNLSCTVSLPVILIAVVLGAITIFLSASGSARRASKVSPIVAIRNQNDVKIKAKKLKTPKLISKIWGVGGSVSYKNIKRNKRKYRTLVISIIVCTTIYIVISYFMSMGFDLINGAYGEDEYNISFKSYGSEKDDEIINKIIQLDNIDDYVLYTYTTAEVSGLEYTKKYKETNFNGFTEEDIELYGNTLTIICLDENNYKKYIKQLGLKESDMQNKGILINNDKERTLSSSGDTLRWEFIDIYDANAGDKFTMDFEDYSAVPEVCDDTEEYVKHVYIDMEVAKVTDERPIGIKDVYGIPYFIVNKNSFEKMKQEADYLHEYVECYFMTEKADALQDEIYKILDQEVDDDDPFSVENVDAEVRTVNSIMLVFAIFAYGLITVIALIGVTNIINTINTSMELRAREFAMLRSVGMTNKEFNRMVRLETIFAGSKALIFGIPFGLIISYAIYWYETRDNMVIPYAFPLKAVILCIVVVYLILAAIMKMSLTKINKKNIIDTIKDETT